MKPRTLLAILILVLAAGISVAFVAYARYADQKADREFAAQAELVEQTLYVPSWEWQSAGKEWSPAWKRSSQEQPQAIEERNARNAQVDADAQQAALRLRTVQKRELALRWLETQRRLREIFNRAKSARDIYQSQTDLRSGYCVHGLNMVCPRSSCSPRERADVFLSCLNDARRDYDRSMQTLKVEYARLEAEAASVWVKFVAITPAIGRSQPNRSP